MPINFNIDLSARRRQQQALAELEKQRQAMESLTGQLLGTPTEGPPTATGLQSRMGGMLPGGPMADLVETQLTSGVPALQQGGLGSAQALLEQQRLNQLDQSRIKQITSATSRLDLANRPAISSLVELAKLPGTQGEEAAKQLVQELGGFTLSESQTRYTPFGERIAGLEEGAIPPKERRASESTLGARFKTDTSAFSNETDAMAKVRALGFNASPTAATDNSLIFQYARLQSPGIVTKDDFEAARKTGGLPASVVNFMNQMVDGKLPDNVRAQLVQAAALQYKGVSDIYDLREKGFRSLAKDRGLDPNKVVGSGRVKAKYEDLLNIDPRTNLLVAPPPPPGTVIRQVK